MWTTAQKARESINSCLEIKKTYRGMWNATEEYFNGSILASRDYDPTKLLSRDCRRWGLDNLIPDTMGAYAAWVLSRPFRIHVSPMGDDGSPVRYLTSNCIQKCMDYYKSEPAFRDDIRQIAVRMKLFNMVGQVDYWDDLRKRPASRIINHNDLFIDPTATNGVNLVGGPKFVAIRILLSPDEAENRYGEARVKSMTKGLILDHDREKMNERKVADAYDELYEVIEWYGIDETHVRIEEARTQETALNEINAAMDGSLQGVDPDIDHQQAMDYGDSLMVTQAQQYAGGMPEGMPSKKKDKGELISWAMNTMMDMGMGAMVQGYMGWRDAHQKFITDGDKGGMEPKYPGYVYRAEFQITGNTEDDGILVEPETLNYPHYEIPISIYRAYPGTDPGLFSFGPMAQVLAIQNDVEYWEKCQKDFAHYQSRPNMMIDIDALDRKQLEAIGGLNGVLDKIREGLYVFFTRNQKGVNSEPHFANPGTFSFDVIRLLDYKRYRIQEIIGPTPSMRGQSSGEESGKKLLVKQQSAGLPMNDVLNLIESPLQMCMSRMTANVLAYGDINEIAQIAGQERAMAVDAIRDETSQYYIPDFRMAVKVNLGNGFPTDHEFLINYGMTVLQAGLADAEEVGEKIQSPIKLHNPMPQMPGQPGTAPGAPGPGQASPPAPTQVRGMA